MASSSAQETGPLSTSSANRTPARKAVLPKRKKSGPPRDAVNLRDEGDFDATRGTPPPVASTSKVQIKAPRRSVHFVDDVANDLEEDFDATANAPAQHTPVEPQQQPTADEPIEQEWRPEDLLNMIEATMLPEGVTEEQQHQEIVRLEAAQHLLQRYHEDNAKYATTLGAAIATLSHARQRLGDLETFAEDLIDELEPDPSLDLQVPGLQEVALPWFLHFHARELGTNPDAEERDEFLKLTRGVPWTDKERKALAVCVRSEADLNLHGIAQNRGLTYDELMDEMNREGLSQHIDGFDLFTKRSDCVDWDKVAAHIDLRGRKGSECKSQWLNKDHPVIKKNASDVIWKKDERERLLQIVEDFGPHDWREIARRLGTNRTPAACLSTWRQRSVEKISFTQEDDDNLKLALKLFGENWQTVSRHVGRQANACITRWTKTLQPLRRGKWTAEEDENLLAAVKACGKVWSRISMRVPDRSDAQCRERYYNVLDPTINRDDWTPEEDIFIMQKVEEMGKSWGKISIALQIASGDGRVRPDNRIMRRHSELSEYERRKREESDPIEPPRTFYRQKNTGGTGHGPRRGRGRAKTPSARKSTSGRSRSKAKKSRTPKAVSAEPAEEDELDEEEDRDIRVPTPPQFNGNGIDAYGMERDLGSDDGSSDHGDPPHRAPAQSTPAQPTPGPSQPSKRARPSAAMMIEDAQDSGGLETVAHTTRSGRVTKRIKFDAF